MQSFLSHIAWESEVWIAEDPDHMIHFNRERYLGPYSDGMPPKPVEELESVVFANLQRANHHLNSTLQKAITSSKHPQIPL